MSSNPMLRAPRRTLFGYALCLSMVLGGCEPDSESKETDKDKSTSTEDDDRESGSSGPGQDKTDPIAQEDCSGAVEPDELWVEFEDEVLKRVNDLRAKGASCGSKGDFESAPPLKANAKLRCAARRHSADMIRRDFFEHTNPDGERPSQRMKKAGYDGRMMGENIAVGQTSPKEVMDAWMKSDGHCANVMNARYQDLGVGYVADPSTKYRHFWTQNFGAK